MKTKRCFISLKDSQGMAMAVGILFLSIGFIAAVSGCSDSDSTTSAVIASAVVTDEEGTLAIASVTEGDLDIENATVSVNGVTLTYGLPLEFRTEEGFDVNVTLPVYYAELNQLTSGDIVNLSARAYNGALIYDRRMVTIPGKPTLVQPVAGQEIFSNENVPMQWNASANANGYVAGYMDPDVLSEESTDDNDPGYYFEYVGAPTTEMTVPSAYTVVGDDATFSVTAVSGDTDIFTSEEDPTGSFLVAAASASVEAKIEDTPGFSFTPAENPDINQASQGLSIVREYNKRIEIKGYSFTFKVRECDPRQIQAPGSIGFSIKMRGRKKSLAFIEVYDINGNKYGSWPKARIYKRKSKKWKPRISVSPGTTVVFGTHDASYRGATYSY